MARVRKADEFDLGNDSDPFDGLDEADLDTLERPAKKRQRFSTSPPPDHLPLAQRLLTETFGFTSFRYEQAGVIQSILAGDNALAVFPTGAGKSLCYQIPAIAFPELDRINRGRAPQHAGLTIVVSPLLALMKDQVDALQKRGISADSIDSTKSWEQQKEVYAKIQNSELRILYCAPERLNNEGFAVSMRDVPGGIRLIAVDEAHCVSEWGHSFRPDYLKVARFADEIKAERVVCLTATATPEVARDICKAFKIKDECVYRTSPYRPNLELMAKTIDSPGPADHIIDVMFGFQIKTEADQRFEELFHFLRANPGPTLIYVALQNQAETHAGVLTEQGFNAAAFHGGMKAEVKAKIQDDFMASRIQIICATIAFGMGIDKPDIRNIVHWDLSNTVEEYSQQIGRAGRDGKPSRCMFYLAPSAFYLREVFARGDLPSRGSLDALFMDILKQARGRIIGEAFKVSHYHQAREFDIRESPLSVIYATLELRFGLFRATTSEYSSYKFEAFKSYFPVMKKDNSVVGRAVFAGAVKAQKYHAIDVKAVATKAGVKRIAIIEALNKLNQQGHIKLMTTGVQQCYIVQKRLPQSESEIKEIIDKLYAELLKRERDAVKRGKEVMGLITGKQCFSLSLAQHFGMGLPEGKSKCGHCTFCATGAPVMPPHRPLAKTTADSIKQVLATTSVRDDPRFLARVAFGIRSPRISQLKLEKTNAFRSLAHHDFDALLREFSNVCNEVQKVAECE